MPACNGFTTGGINELVILAYSSNKLVTVPPRSLYKTLLYRAMELSDTVPVTCLVLKFDAIHKQYFFLIKLDFLTGMQSDCS